MESLIAKNRVYKELGCIVTSKENAQIWRILQKICTAANPLQLSFLSTLVVKTFLQELQLSKVLYLRRKMVMFNRLFVDK